MKQSNLIKSLAFAAIFCTILMSCNEDNDDNPIKTSTYLFTSNNSDGI